MARIPLARTLHDVGLAAWFGGTLANAVSLNAAAGAVEDPKQVARVANAGWARWTPLNAVAIGAHLVGGALIVRENRGRIAGQKGVAAWTLSKTAFTGAALAATGYGRVLGAKMKKAGDVPVEKGAVPSSDTPSDIAKAQQQLRGLQWIIPALTGGILVNNVFMGEQQRPAEVAKGAVQRVADAAVTAAKHPGAVAAAGKKAVKHAV